jgi:hypothetical protein
VRLSGSVEVMTVQLCDVCDEPATPVRPLVRVYDLGFCPLDVHDDCWADADADAVTP